MNNERVLPTKNYIYNFGRMIVIITVYVVMLVPFLRTLFLAIPTSDDFCLTVNDGFIVYEAMKLCKYMWWNFTGEVVYIFFQTVFNPLAYVSFESHIYGVILCVSFLCYVLSWRFLSKSVLRCYFKISDRFKLELISIFLLFTILINDNYHEVFYWFVGNVYLWGYCIIYIYLALLIECYFDDNYDSNKYYIMIICGVFACNIMVMCVMVGVSYIVMLLICIKKRGMSCPDLKRIIPLVLFFLSGCLTVFAPGNFKRKTTNGDIDVLKSFARAVMACAERISYIFSNEYVLIACICIFCFGIMIGIKYKMFFTNYFGSIIVLVVCMVGTILPVAVGYGESKIMNNRICFIFDSMFIPQVEFITLCLGACFSDRVLTRIPRFYQYITGFFIIGCLLITVGFCIENDEIKKCEYIHQIIDYDKAKAEREVWIDIYKDIYSSDKKDVVVHKSSKHKIRSGIIENPNINEDSEYWVNMEIKRYFNKDSISVFFD